MALVGRRRGRDRSGALARRHKVAETVTGVRVHSGRTATRKSDQILFATIPVSSRLTRQCSRLPQSAGSLSGIKLLADALHGEGAGAVGG